MLPKYYLNDYFTLIDSPILKEREFMKTDIREEKKESDIKANYQNGILTISFPKEELPHKESQNIIIK